MPGFERAVTIDRPPHQVYAILDDVRNARRWMPAIRRIEVLTPDNAVDVGYRWRETRVVWGLFRITMPVEIVRHDPPAAWGIRVEDGRFRAHATFELTPSGDGTLVALREDVEDLRGSERRAQRVARMMEKADDDLLARLKAHAESQPRALDPEPVKEVEEPKPTKARKAKGSSKKAKKPSQKAA